MLNSTQSPHSQQQPPHSTAPAVAPHAEYGGGAHASRPMKPGVVGGGFYKFGAPPASPPSSPDFEANASPAFRQQRSHSLSFPAPGNANQPAAAANPPLWLQRRTSLSFPQQPAPSAPYPGVNPLARSDQLPLPALEKPSPTLERRHSDGPLQGRRKSWAGGMLDSINHPQPRPEGMASMGGEGGNSAAQGNWRSLWTGTVTKKREEEVNHLLSMTLEPF